jgi:hypothetical protein
MPAAVRDLATQIQSTLIAATLFAPPNNDVLDSTRIVIDYLPRFEPKDLAETKIVIAPRSQDLTWISRVSRRREIAIQIAIMQSATPGSELWDSLLDLTATIDETLAAANYAALTNSVNRPGTWLSSSCDLYSIEAAEQHSVFRSVITASYALNT